MEGPNIIGGCAYLGAKCLGESKSTIAVEIQGGRTWVEAVGDAATVN